MNAITHPTDRTSFLVLPMHLNHMKRDNDGAGIIFGGKFMSELDKACAIVVHRAVKDSDTATRAVTHKFAVEFSKPSFVGDTIIIDTEIESVGNKSIVLKQKAYREGLNSHDLELVGVTSVVFVTMHGDIYINHNLNL
jgi:acyl-CoA hydrolase